MKSLPLFSLFLVGLAATPALAQAPSLVYSTKNEIAYLDFTPAGKTASSLKLACPKGSAEVDVAEYDAATADQALKLTSGAVTGSLDAKKSSGARGDYLRAHTKASDKALAAFRSSGTLEVAGAGFTHKIAATGDGKRDLEQFFIACEERDGD